jgi:glycosyltransferase involved in cell wall biosynthesis
MKKRLVFVLPSLDAGGAEKSLVNLLCQIDFERFDVDLILLHARGIFLPLLPKEVTVVSIEGNYPSFIKPIASSLLSYLLKGKIKLAYHRLLFAIKNKFITREGIAEQQSWNDIQKAIPTFSKSYDVAIGFLEKSSIYLTVDKINATKKIGFIHNDYTKLGIDSAFDKPYFNQLDALVTVSDECSTVLKALFFEMEHLVSVMHNIVSPRVIHKLAQRAITDSIEKNSFSVISVGRLNHQKGFDWAIETCGIIVDKGFPIRWYVIGEGAERVSLEEIILSKGLQDHFILLGLRPNPYPYIKQAMIYVQPSRFEGKSIAIDEAKILLKPIVVTDFSTVHDQIVHQKNGIITTMSPESIAAGIIQVFTDKALRESMVSNLEKEDLGTEIEIETFYQLLAT